MSVLMTFGCVAVKNTESIDQTISLGQCFIVNVV